MEFLLKQCWSSSLARAIAEHHHLLWLRLHSARNLMFEVEMPNKSERLQTPSVGSPRPQSGDILHACFVYLYVCM